MDTLAYSNVDGYRIPNLTLPPIQEGDLGKYGRLRLAHLRENKPLLHMHMMTQCTLWEHLLGIQQAADERMELLTAQMAEAQGVDEALKARDQMLWLQKTNNIRARAEELVTRELIYS